MKKTKAMRNLILGSTLALAVAGCEQQELILDGLRRAFWTPMTVGALLSILLAVIYIRVRFAEYSYGWAAVAAVVHDILTTLGAVALLIWAPFIQVDMKVTARSTLEGRLQQVVSAPFAGYIREASVRAG